MYLGLESRRLRPLPKPTSHPVEREREISRVNPNPNSQENMNRSDGKTESTLWTTKYLETKTRRFFACFRDRSFSFSRANPRLTRRFIKTGRPDKKSGAIKTFSRVNPKISKHAPKKNHQNVTKLTSFLFTGSIRRPRTVSPANWCRLAPTL